MKERLEYREREQENEKVRSGEIIPARESKLAKREMCKASEKETLSSSQTLKNWNLNSQTRQQQGGRDEKGKWLTARGRERLRKDHEHKR